MSMMDRLWDAFQTVLKMNDKIVSQAATLASQQAKIEELTGRVIRLETALELALANRVLANSAPRSRRLPRLKA